MDPVAWQPFSATVQSANGTARVFLKGELDLAGVDRFKQALEQAETSLTGLLVLDISELTFIDSTGLEVILRAARRAHDNDRRLVVARPSVYVRKLLQMTAIDLTLDIVDDVV